MNMTDRQLTSDQCYKNADHWLRLWLFSNDPRHRQISRDWEIKAHQQFATEELELRTKVQS